MAKSALDNDLFKALRSSGLRKRVAREVAKVGNGNPPEEIRKTIKSLRSLADELEDRVRGGPKQRRQAAAKKAARTRQQKSRQRSAAAKKAARTRARS
jgi:hypothetical protein